MNPTTHATEGNAPAPVLYMALELSNRSWRLAFGDGAKRRQVSVPAADLAALADAVTKAKEHFEVLGHRVAVRKRASSCAAWTRVSERWRAANSGVRTVGCARSSRPNR